MAINLKEMSAEPELLAGGHRSCAGCAAPAILRQALHVAGPDTVVGFATGCMEVSHDDLSLHGVARAVHPLRVRELRRHRQRRRGRLPRAAAARAGFPRTRRSTSSPSAATAAPTTSASSRSPARWSAGTDALRLLRQQRLHEHRHPAVQRHAPRGRDQHQPQRQRHFRQAAAAQGPHGLHDRAQHPVRGPGLGVAPHGLHAQGGPRRWRSTGRRSSTSCSPAIAAGAASRRTRSSWPASPSRPAGGRCTRWTTADGRSTTSPRTSCPWPIGSSSRPASSTWLADDKDGIVAWHQEQVDKTWAGLLEKEEKDAPVRE